MNLGRVALLIEGLPAQQVDPRGLTASHPKISLRSSDADDPAPRVRAQAISRSTDPSREGVSAASIPADPKAVTKSVANPYELRAKAGRAALPTRRADPHAAFNKLPHDKAVEQLRDAWDKRHKESGETQKELDFNKPDPSFYDRPSETGRTVSLNQKNRLPASVPGVKHPDPRVREIAHRMQAHALANHLGDTYDRKEGAPPAKRAQAHVLQHVSSGKLSVMGQFHGKPRPETPEGHKIVYTALSEGLKRRALLAENFLPAKATLEPRRAPPLASDESLHKRIASATPEVAARLKQSMAFREKLRATKDWPSHSGGRSTTIAPIAVPTAAQQTARQTKQSDFPGAETGTMRPAGHQTQVVRPPGHKTQVALNTVQQTAPTAVIPIPAQKSLDEPRPRPERTQSLRIPKNIASSMFVRGPLLQEFIANSTGNTFLSQFPAGTRISGAPGVQGVTDTSKVGLVTAQGGIVPDKKKREIAKKLPDMAKLPKGRDPITKQLEAQPAFPGFPMLARSRSWL